MKTAYPRIPFLLIVKVTDGDVEAINQIVKHYRGYTPKHSLRRTTDGYGNSHMVIDETLRGGVETKLITKVLAFEVK